MKRKVAKMALALLVGSLISVPALAGANDSGVGPGGNPPAASNAAVYCRTGSPPPCPPSSAAPNAAAVDQSQVCPPLCGKGGALGVSRPIKWPPQWQFKTIPPIGCVLRPGGAANAAVVGCSIPKAAVASCKADKGTIGMIDGQLYCRSPGSANSPPPPRDAAGRMIKPPVYPNDYPDEAMQARWEPVNGQPQN